MMIEKYEFGMVQIDGKQYRDDVIVSSKERPKGDHVEPNWWRKEGHRLDKTDLKSVTKANPKALIVGTGYFSRMEVPKETADFVESLGIRLWILPTKEACHKYNELKDGESVVAVLHLTC